MVLRRGSVHVLSRTPKHNVPWMAKSCQTSAPHARPLEIGACDSMARDVIALTWPRVCDRLCHFGRSRRLLVTRLSRVPAADTPCRCRSDRRVDRPARPGRSGEMTAITAGSAVSIASSPAPWSSLRQTFCALPARACRPPGGPSRARPAPAGRARVDQAARQFEIARMRSGSTSRCAITSVKSPSM